MYVHVWLISVEWHCCYVAYTIPSMSENCIDRHVEANPKSVALIWEKDEPGCQEYITYKWVTVYILCVFDVEPVCKTTCPQ